MLSYHHLDGGGHTENGVFPYIGYKEDNITIIFLQDGTLT